MLDKSRVIAAAAVILAGFFAWQALADDPPGVIPPITGETEAKVMPGYAGDLAYSTATNLWLIVAQQDGIKGQFVNEKNKKIGPQINIHSGDGFGPRIAYDAQDKKFLVMWMNGNGNAVFGQFVDDKGLLVGSNFLIQQGKGNFSRKGTLQFDSKTNKFVTTWLEYTSPASARLVTLNQDGSVSKSISVKGTSSVINEPTVALGDSEYCVMWDDRTAKKIFVAPVNPSTGSVGQESVIDDQATFADGISYSPNAKTYLVLYQGLSGADMMMQLLNSCKASPDNEPTMVINNAAGILTYNPTSDTYGIAIQNGPTGENFVYVLDSSGNLVANYTPFTAGKDGNFWPITEPNPTTGTFAAITSEDQKTIKFNSGMGTLGAAPFPQQLPPPQTFTAPTEGLPTDLGQFVGAIFLWSLRIIGLIIFIRFFWAGFKWFTAAGNTGRISDAKDIMKNAALGAVVLFAAYLILYSINPDFVAGTLNLPGISNPPPATQSVPITCNSGVCSNGFVGPCQYDTQCGAPVACNNGVCNNGFVGPCQTAAQCQQP